MAKRRSWTTDDINRLEQLSVQGATLLQMASELDRTVDAVRRKCKNLAVPFANADPSYRSRPKRWTESELDELRRIVTIKPARVAADHFGITVGTVRSVMRRHNIPGRGTHRVLTPAERAAMVLAVREHWASVYPPQGPWICTVCKVEKPVSAFPKATSQHMCRECRRTQHVAQAYGITIDQYRRLLEAQRGLCAICREPESKTHHETGTPFMLSVDHDHACCPGKTSCGSCVRGLLCSNCNRVLGHIENKSLVDGILAYLQTEPRPLAY